MAKLPFRTHIIRTVLKTRQTVRGEEKEREREEEKRERERKRDASGDVASGVLGRTGCVGRNSLYDLGEPANPGAKRNLL